jgi:hypothetical protein
LAEKFETYPQTDFAALFPLPLKMAFSAAEWDNWRVLRNIYFQKVWVWCIFQTTIGG